MKAFIDFEASSLEKLSYPIEVAWAFENGDAKTHPLKTLPHWTNRDEPAEAVYWTTRDTLLIEEESSDAVSARMIEGPLRPQALRQRAVL